MSFSVTNVLMPLGMLAVCGILQAQSPEAAQLELLQRFVGPSALSYRADIELDQGSQKISKVVLVQDGRLSIASPFAQSIPSEPQSDDVKTLLANYQAEWEGNAKQLIAQRETRRIRFVPKDGWRYTRVFWLDEETGLPLKSEIYRKEELIERMQVQTIRFAQSDHKSEAPRSVPAAFSVRNAPNGFELTSVFVEPNRAQQIYSDGLAHVSVFVQVSGSLPAEGYSQRGGTGFVVRRSGNIDMIAVGEVPQSTLERFLSGLDVAE